ncbi:hypothetical protein P691DRAFT_106247 [Macrolepiota fuliginosa MF-IS2]|uniref:Protein kinase domain-containing protein n=1 Tax=Macrolepiota fuliginosa MF-IS2 TaxID=1400762 RepID=A0A9P6C3U0_9AGAR|nr:hypothetical protein P691DRAFT_106247 [Macrolepiota fuliginosa MF-IS2]
MEIPVRIYHSVYAHFLRTMETPLKDLDFTEIELDQAALLLTLFSARYEDKESRITAIRQALSTAVHPNLLMEKHLNLDRQTGNIIELDGAVFQICYDPVNLCYSQGLSALTKVTNEVGEGGCNPAARVAYYYAHISVSQFITDYIKSNSPRPSLLITITGPHLAVYGAVFVGRPVVQLLAKHTFSATENIDRRPDEGGTGGEGGYSSIDHGTLLVARLLRALRSGIDELQHYYSELPFPPQSSPVPLGVLQPHPWLTELETEGYGKVQLTYTQQMEPKKALFRARMRVEKGHTDMDDTAELDVVVKFTHSYHGGAHKLLAAQKLAPVLYHCRWEKDVEMIVVIMEFVKNGDCIPDMLPSDRRDVYNKSLQRAVETLHGKQWVFGDLRAPNVLFAGEGVRLIDFEWCGTEGRVRYPPAINLNMKDVMHWSPDVTRGGLIKKEHDVHMLRKLTGMA